LEPLTITEKFSSRFNYYCLFNEDNLLLPISTHFKKGRKKTFCISLPAVKFETNLWNNDFRGRIEEKNYAFENMVTSKDLSEFVFGR